MNYKKISNVELSKFPYPNLVAELMWSGYSICTLGEHMGLEGRRKQNDTEIWDKLHGKAKITFEEAIGLTSLFGVSFEYLFSHELKTLCDMTAAYWRWYDWNKKNTGRTREKQSTSRNTTRTKGQAIFIGICERRNNMERRRITKSN